MFRTTAKIRVGRLQRHPGRAAHDKQQTPFETVGQKIDNPNYIAREKLRGNFKPTINLIFTMCTLVSSVPSTQKTGLAAIYNRGIMYTR